MKKSLVELHTAVIIMSATGLFAKLITLSPGDIIAFRCLIAALALFLFTRLTGARLAVRRRDLGWPERSSSLAEWCTPRSAPAGP